MEEAALRMFSWLSVGFGGLLWNGLEFMLTGCMVRGGVIVFGCCSEVRRIVIG